MVFINIDMDVVGNWVECCNFFYSGYIDLVVNLVVYDLVCECVEKVNVDLVVDLLLVDLQIYCFLILYKEFDFDDEELICICKVWCGFIVDKYVVLIEVFYVGYVLQYIEIQVKFEDGCQGMILVDFRIVDVKIFKML